MKLPLTAAEVINRKEQKDKLGYCPKCKHEYTEAEVENIDFDRAPVPFISQCPKCHTEEERIIYWCTIYGEDKPRHGTAECYKFHREGL